MLDMMPPAGPDLPADSTLDVPPVAAPRRRRWVLLGVVGGVTLLVVVAFAVFAFGIVGASAAGGCGGP